MRQVSGHSPIPVVENVAYMKFSYDLFNDTTSSPAVNCSNPGAATDGCNTAGASRGLLPNQITKINILNMAMNSTLKGAHRRLSADGFANVSKRPELDIHQQLSPLKVGVAKRQARSRGGTMQWGTRPWGVTKRKARD